MSPRKRFQLNHTIFQDLAAWSATHPPDLDTLYSSPHVVLTVFRSLPPLARLYVPRLLYLPARAAAPVDAFRNSLRRRQRAYDRHDVAVRALRALRILHTVDDNGAIDLDHDPQQRPPPAKGLCLHPTFSANLRRVLVDTVDPVLGGPVDEALTPASYLDKFSADKLETILNYLVEPSRAVPHANIITALQHAQILEDGSNGLSITSAGFHFLLKHSFAQLWVLLRAVLDSIFAPHLLHPFQLLFSLALARPGAPYAFDALPREQQQLLPELHELGIVVLDGNAGTFVPTHVGVRLLSAANRVGADVPSSELPTVAKSAGEIHIFVETNFRVYAYTTSMFQTNLLGLFTHLRFRLPGMVVGHLTRDAVRRALMNGITAEQIIAYLNSHAHPRMKKGVIPPNVGDGLRLWQGEKERVKTTKGILMADFQTPQAYERVLAYCKDIAALMWSNDTRQQLVVDLEYYDDIKRFVRQQGIQ